jgi:hypothetical protein
VVGYSFHGVLVYAAFTIYYKKKIPFKNPAAIFDRINGGRRFVKIKNGRVTKMKKTVFTLIAGLCAAQALNAAEPSFTDQLSLIPTAAAEVKIPEAPPVRAKNGRYVQVSGYVTLNGTAWMPGPNGGFTNATLTGYASFGDSSGQITSNGNYINTSASMWIYPNQYVFQTVRPYVYATFYRDGKRVGTVNMSGSITVNGWPNTSTVYLSGGDYLSGSLYVEDAE